MDQREREQCRRKLAGMTAEQIRGLRALLRERDLLLELGLLGEELEARVRDDSAGADVVQGFSTVPPPPGGGVA
jgi:hypothetical protein